MSSHQADPIVLGDSDSDIEEVQPEEGGIRARIGSFFGRGQRKVGSSSRKRSPPRQQQMEVRRQPQQPHLQSQSNIIMSDTIADASLSCANGTAGGTRALMKGLAQLRSSTETDKLKIEITDNLYSWVVRMPSVSFLDDYVPLFHDLEEYSEKYNQPAEVVMELMFPANYPAQPPFVRVVRPRFQFHTGHVTIGGSICTELLTNSGTPASWNSKLSIESLLLYLHTTLMDGEARIQIEPDQHHPNPEMDYSKAEAEAAFRRVARYHGWKP